MPRRILFLLPLVVVACRSGEPAEGLAPARQTGGPRIVFDLARKPVPEIPFPNDVVTRGDPGSPTGLRLNSTLAVPTQLEQRTRVLLDQLDGFGTYAPITVSFDADIDVEDLLARQNDADPANDGVYLIQIDDGSVWPIDVGGGHFPYVLANPSQYFPNDPFAQHRNLLFPSCGPGANVLVPPGPSCSDPDPRHQVDQLAPFYERSTRTLIVRPTKPLQQEESYAVLLTDRLTDAQGRAVVSPGSGINHPAQTGELRPVVGRLPAGAQLDHVAYAWAFTTQSTTRDLEAIQLGLRQQGPLAAIGVQYAAAAAGQTASGAPLSNLTLLQGRDPRSGLSALQTYIVPASELAPVISDPALAPLFGNPDSATLNALLATFQYIDYFVSASFISPSFLDVPSGAPETGTFQIDLNRGDAHTQPETVTFLLAVPKRNGTHLPPFPTVLTGHGYMGTRSLDLLAFAGTFAKYGLATISIDAFGHGLDPIALAPIVQVFGNHGLGAFATALLTTRARDLDHDGIVDPGGDFFSSDAFHTRDAVRQTVVDWMMLVRYLRTFDGNTVLIQGGGAVSGGFQILAGDFNNDGIPDVAGPAVWPVQLPNPAGGNFNVGDPNPGADLFAFGVSLGGIVAGVLPAVEPTVKAAAPASGGGGLADVAARTELTPVVSSVFLGTIGPFFTTCLFDSGLNRCAPSGTPTLVLVVQDLTRERDIPIVPLTLAPGDRLTVTNLTAVTDDCARDHACATATADTNGNVRVGVTATGPILAVQGSTVTVLQRGDALLVSVLRTTGNEPQNINTFGFDTSFYGVTYHAGDPLTAPAPGWGYERNTPEFRRFVHLSQAILEPGDPIAYAPHWFSNLLPVRNGVPAPALVVGTVGDTSVPVSTAIAMARAAGLVDETTDQVLINAGVVEGVANLRTLVDPTNYSQGTDGFNAPRLDPPLRDQLTRNVTLSDGSTATSALLLPYMNPNGQHGFHNPQPDKPFDMDQFLANLIGRWFETRGRELHFDVCQAHEPPDCPWIPSPPP